jgi:protein-S-isoprenylcysteine O-methyltransferase Ste14
LLVRLHLRAVFHDLHTCVSKRKSKWPFRGVLDQLGLGFTDGKEYPMKIRVLAEGVLLLVIGLVCFVDGLRLANNIDPNAVNDTLGPGYYILFISILLIIIGIAYLVSNRKLLRKNVTSDKQPAGQEINKTVIYLTIVFLVYILLIYFIGYLFATLIFFLLEFKLAGVKSFKSNAAVSLIVSVVFYVVFVKYCDLVFPHGIFSQFIP